jgi:hypothetical protein
MKKRAIAATFLMSAVFAGQAAAGGYVEGRAGIADGTYLSTTETVGAAVGFEVGGAGGNFFGAEFVVDAYDGFSSSAAGINLRAGTAIDEKSRLFATLGRIWQRQNYTYYDGIFLVTVDGYFYDTTAGVGYQTDISPNSYVSVQFQRIFDSEINRATVGIGLKF